MSIIQDRGVQASAAAAVVVAAGAFAVHDTYPGAVIAILTAWAIATVIAVVLAVRKERD